jgi:aryl-alcohol dehydrogenase-like predicted oxidoreductase
MLADLVPILKQKGVGVMNAAPFSARLLTDQPLPPWHKATPQVREVAAKAAAHCRQRGSEIAKLAVQYSVANPDMATCIVGSANPQNVEKWVKWAAEPVDRELLDEVLQILRPIHNWFYIEGRPENNDS